MPARSIQDYEVPMDLYIFFKARTVHKRALIWELAYMWKLRKSDSCQFPEIILDKFASFYDFPPQAKYFSLKGSIPSKTPLEVKALAVLLDPSHLPSQALVFSSMKRKQ